MKRTCLSFTLCLFILFSCTQHRYPTSLAAADSLCAVRPDSALALLEQMDSAMQKAGKADRMYYQLLLADAMNKAYVDIKSDSILKEVVHYYDRHGSSNERMRAHYLLGCAYRDMGEAPMALRCYQDAVEQADTTSKECNYSLMSKVYGQMGNLFYQQDLANRQIDMVHHAVKYSLLTGDTLTAMFHYEQLCGAYEDQGRNDSALFVADSLITWFYKHQMKRDAAITQGRAAVIFVKEGQFEKARDYMTEYEQHSGLFDDDGNIAKGREVYYYFKGMLYLKENRYDSAEYYFRKELSEGKDCNNQNAGAKGLATLYEKYHNPDSVAKYYRYVYDMNDSLYTQMNTEQVEHTRSMYDYTRHQEIARKESEKARLEQTKFRTLVIAIFLSTTLLFLLLYRLNRRVKKRLERYEICLEELRQMRMEKEALGKHAAEYQHLIEKKEKEINSLKARIGKYGKLAYFNTAVAERSLKGSPSYQRIAAKAIKGQALTGEDEQTINVLVKEYLPGFDDFMESNSVILNAHEHDVCLLLRLHFKPVEISGMLMLSKSMVSQVSREVMRKVFKEQGSSKELAMKLRKIY